MLLICHTILCYGLSIDSEKDEGMDWSSRRNNNVESGYLKKHQIIPEEIMELNWRVWSFIIIVGIAVYLLISFPVKPFEGLVDPFYAPSILILPLVGLFRITCYAYRKDYHRHLFKHPLACGIESRQDSSSRSYTGETGLFRIENLHRYFLYGSIAILPFFYFDFYKAITFSNSITIASLILLTNAIIVTVYTFSCHAFRHLTAGGIDCYSCKLNGPSIKSYFNIQSYFNSHHEQIAWASLLMFVLVDLYLRALSVGLPLNLTLIHI